MNSPASPLGSHAVPVVMDVLREAAARGEGPLRWTEILRRVPADVVKPEALEPALALLRQRGLVAEARRGYSWVTPVAGWERRFTSRA